MGSLSWDGRNIEDLPAEMLQMAVSRFPRTVLEEAASRLHGVDAIASGNWAVVAEKLGYCDNSQLDRFARQAQVARTYPGLLMLQEWSRAPGSTAYVLLNVLRDSGREDVLHMVVDALYNVHYMLLSVMVEDQVTREKRFLRVRTKKTSTLAASLENELPGLSCYTIAGPRNGISFQTIAEELQGKQLTLRRHFDPQEDSVEQIYGTALISRPPTQPSTRNNQTTVTTAVTSTTTASSPTSSSTQTTTSQMMFNILPTERICGPQKLQGSAQPTISVTFPKVPFSSTVQLDMNMPEGVQWLNNLSRQDSPGLGNGTANHRPCSPCRPPQDVAMATTCNNLLRMSPAVDHRNAGLTCNNLQCMLPAGKLENTGAACNTLQCTPPAGDGECGKKLKIDNLGLTARDFTQHSLMSFQDINFPLLTMDTRDSNDIYPEEAPAPCQRQQSMGSLNPIELTVPKELSFADSLEGWTPVKQLHEKTEDERKVFPDDTRQHPHGMDNILSPEDGHGRHGLHQMAMLNNLFSSTSAKCVMTSQSDYIPHDHPLVFQNRRPCSPLFTSGGLPATASKIEPTFEKSDIKLPGKSSPLFSKKSCGMQRELEQSRKGMTVAFHDGQTADYVPHHFIEDQSKMMMTKNASSAGAVDTNKAISPTALDLTRTPRRPSQEKMEYLPVDNTHILTSLASESCGPTPCTYTSPFIGPDVFDPNQFKYCHNPTNPAGVPLSDPLSLLPTTGNWPKSESMDLDDGYIALPVGGASPYIHATTSFGGSSLDRSISCALNDGSSEYSSTLPAHSRNASAPELCSMSQEVVSPSLLHDCLQARSRKPIMQDFPTSILDTEQDMSSSMSSPFFRRGSDASVQVRPSSKASSLQSLPYSRSYDTIPADDDQSQSLDPHKGRCQAPSSHPEHQATQTPASKPTPLEIGMTEVPGWCPGVTDRTINQIMSKYINDDGNFIVWYYSARKTHVITVSHMGIRHYAVHNKTVAGDQAVFYIFEGGFESTSLASLIKHYMRNGLAEPTSTMLVHGVNDPTKKFTTPEESSGSRSSRNRLSHVKLKRPLVVRYGNAAIRK